LTISNALEFDLTTDYGTQKKDSANGEWYGFALIGRYRLTNTVAAALRGEYYKDEHQIILSTGSSNGFDGFGISANIDFQLSSALLWRTEARLLRNKSQIFNSKDGLTDKSTFIVSSFAISI
ncbi:MAG: outer membrane beta-barrel protein, partial [Ignavibacteriota bacterium]